MQDRIVQVDEAAKAGEINGLKRVKRKVVAELEDRQCIARDRFREVLRSRVDGAAAKPDGRARGSEDKDFDAARDQALSEAVSVVRDAALLRGPRREKRGLHR